jgi:hypothetical protein
VERDATPKNLMLELTRLVASDIRPSRTSPGQFDYPFQLSAVPDGRWSEAFRRAYEGLVAAGKRPARLVGAQIIATVNADDDKRRVVEVIRQAMRQANAECQEMWASSVRKAESKKQAERDDDELLRRLQDEAREVLV